MENDKHYSRTNNKKSDCRRHSQPEDSQQYDGERHERNCSDGDLDVHALSPLSLNDCDLYSDEKKLEGRFQPLQLRKAG